MWIRKYMCEPSLTLCAHVGVLNDVMWERRGEVRGVVYVSEDVASFVIF